MLNLLHLNQIGRCAHEQICWNCFRFDLLCLSLWSLPLQLLALYYKIELTLFSFPVFFNSHQVKVQGETSLLSELHMNKCISNPSYICTSNPCSVSYYTLAVMHMPENSTWEPDNLRNPLQSNNMCSTQHLYVCKHISMYRAKVCNIIAFKDINLEEIHKKLQMQNIYFVQSALSSVCNV